MGPSDLTGYGYRWLGLRARSGSEHSSGKWRVARHLWGVSDSGKPTSA